MIRKKIKQCSGSSDGLLYFYHVNPYDLACSRVIPPVKSTSVLSLSGLKSALDCYRFRGGTGEGYIPLGIYEARWRET